MEDSTLSYKDLEEIYPNTIIVRLRGMFYDAYGDSAIVLGKVTGYKVKKTSENASLKTGFPVNALKKVKTILIDQEISFIVFEKNEVIYEKSYINTNYEEVLKSNKAEYENLCTEKKEKQLEEGDSVLSVNDYFKVNNDETVQVQFNCPMKTFTEIKELYEQYSSWVYNPGSFDFLITMLISKGLDDFKKG